jgi:hypothetical protein
MIRTVNIKENMPPSDYAVYLLDVAISDSKKMGERALIVIHGYGSHGKGGEIKKAVAKYLATAKKNKIITAYVKGDEWGELNPDKQLICSKCPELIASDQLNDFNSGVTVVLL